MLQLTNWLGRHAFTVVLENENAGSSPVCNALVNVYLYMSNNRKTSIIWTISVEDFKKIVGKSNSLADILRELGYNNHLNSALYRPLKKRIEKDNIDISHIKLGKGSNKGRKFSQKHSKKDYIKILKEKDFVLHYSAKKKIIEFDIIPHKNCAICGLGREWNSIELRLQIDHIDGNPRNNNPSNLRFVCPNCHTQTDTFCMGNRKIKEKNKCKDCKKEISSRKSFRCQSCASKVSNERLYKFNPTKEELYDLVCVQKIPFTKLGLRFGVSDNAVRKRCFKFGINPKTRE